MQIVNERRVRLVRLTQAVVDGRQTTMNVDELTRRRHQTTILRQRVT